MGDKQDKLKPLDEMTTSEIQRLFNVGYSSAATIQGHARDTRPDVAKVLGEVVEEIEPLRKKAVRRESGEVGHKYQQSIGETNGYHKVRAILDTAIKKHSKGE